MYLGQKLMEFATAHGVPKTRKFFRQGLKEGKIDPSRISIRELAESMMGYDWYNALRRHQAAAKMAGQPLMESVNPHAIGPSAFSNISGQLLVDMVWEGFKSPEFIGMKLVRTIPCGPNLGEHVVPGHTQVLNDPSAIAPGEQIPTTKFNERWKVLPAVEKYAEICWLTYEAIAADLLGNIVESARSVGWRTEYWREEQILSVILGLTNGYKESVGNAGTASAKNTYQSSDWDNTQTGQTLTSLRPIQSLRVLMRRITDPDTGKRIPFDGNYPLLVMPERELHAKQIKTATSIAIVPDSTADGDRTYSQNVLNGVGEIYCSSIAERLLTDSGISQSNANEYFYHGDFNKAFFWRSLRDQEVTEAPPQNMVQFTQDVVFGVRSLIHGKAGVWEPRFVGQSINS